MDSYTYFRKASVGAMTATFASLWFPVGPMTGPLGVEILIPAVVSGDSLVPKIEFSDADGGTVYLTITGPTITAAGRYFIPFFSGKLAFAKLTLTATNAATATALAFGAVEARIVPVGYAAQL